MEKTISLTGVVLFGSIGLVALITALFYGAAHQFATAIICAVMTTLSIVEYRAEKKKEEESCSKS